MDSDSDAPEPEPKALGRPPEDGRLEDGRLEDRNTEFGRDLAGDPEDGSDEYPDDYPGDEAFDDPGDGGSTDDDGHSGLPPKLEAWRKRSATGAILTGFALGLQQVFEKKQEQPSIVMQTSGRPPRDLPVDAEVEHGRPRQSVVNIRPWLLGRSASRADGEGGAPTDNAPVAPDAPGAAHPAGPVDAVDTGNGRAAPEDD